jgi:hypothetical protein
MPRLGLGEDLGLLGLELVLGQHPGVAQLAQLFELIERGRACVAGQIVDPGIEIGDLCLDRMGGVEVGDLDGRGGDGSGFLAGGVRISSFWDLSGS